MPAFSAAIFARVSPRIGAWSMSNLVMMVSTGLDDVGAVEPAAQAYLNHGQVHGFSFEMNKCCRGECFKEGWFKVNTLGCFRNFGDDVAKGGFIDFNSAHRDALSDIGQVWTGVSADGVPNATHHVVDHV